MSLKYYFDKIKTRSEPSPILCVRIFQSILCDMLDINIQNEETETKGSYFISINGQKAAEMTYSKAGSDRIIIDHTEVDESQKGNGLGELMVRKAVDDARVKGISIVPLCPFARSVFQKHEELRDVL